ncbi:response regulator [Ktedonobacter robiniae]|uniref:Response regulator n=1 Tax=Ktedonobacter robiniae TaxID=2778365 RepID=A0ABQ3UNT2_9CHLR|nr:response regulator [Ktedonobacter robiniae]GHO54373.1 response regulator [Ktedonobacter robiniae]
MQPGRTHPNLIMVIDDSTIVRKILEVCLVRAGYDVVSFSNGVEAIRWLEKKGRFVPALVFLDIGLPIVDGCSLACYFSSLPIYRQMAIVMLTARNGLLSRIMARISGARAYITKPFTTYDILQTTRTCLRQAGHQDAPGQVLTVRR